MVTEAELLERQRERALYEREVRRAIIAEKERRKQAALIQARRRQQRSGSSGSTKKSPKPSKLSAIAETAVSE